MKKKLSKGKHALVDNEDYKFINSFKWSFSEYAVRWKNIRMHRVIMNAPYGLDVDHIDGNKFNNQKFNLRICSRTENIRNSKKRTNLSSIYKGVSWQKNENRWQTSIRFNGKLFGLGKFKNERHAAMAYDIWAKEMFVQFAKLNFQQTIT